MERYRQAQEIGERLGVSAALFGALAFVIGLTAAPASLRADSRYDDRVVINFAGDIAFPNGWGGIEQVDEKKVGLYALVQPILDSADLNAANIECPLTDTETTVDKRFPIRCKPERIAYFTKAGFNLLCLANNHSLDAGKQGLLDTIELFRRTTTPALPLWWSGTGDDADAARAPARLQPPRRSSKVTFFGVANTGKNSIVASLHDPTLTERVAEAAKTSDIVIVSSHYGPEYHHEPWASTVKRYHELIDAGADVIHGHHAHCVQGVERYKHGIIFYNFGNFSFASRTRRHFETGARLYSMIGRVTFEKGEIVQVELIPLYANNAAKWVLGDQAIDPRHATPQLLSGKFADYALDEFEAFAAAVPGAAPTKLMRVGDRDFVDVGRGPLSDEQKAFQRRKQRREYQAVIAAGAAPRPATEEEQHWSNHAGTPWPPPKYDDAAERKKAARARHAKQRADKRKHRGKKSKKSKRHGKKHRQKTKHPAGKRHKSKKK